MVIAAGLLWYVKFLLTHGQPSIDERRRSEQIETSITAPRGGYTDKHKSEEKTHKKISHIALMAIATIVVVAVAIGVYLFSNPSSEIILPTPAKTYVCCLSLGVRQIIILYLIILEYV